MDLNEIRATLACCLAALDQHLAGASPSPPGEDDPSRYRVRPGGPLNKAGISEMERRFAAGESDSTIARSMRVTPDGVSRRRAMQRGGEQMQ
jgi:hypothetical protein